MTARSVISALLLAAALPVSFAHADPGDDPDDCGEDGPVICDNGAYTGLSEKATRELPKERKVNKPKAGKPAVVTVTLNYTTRLACAGNSPTSSGENSCAAALESCESIGAPGPLSNIYVREEPVDPKDPPSAWSYVDRTCFPEVVPNSDSRPRLTLAMIKAQWERTPFSKPTVSSQPVGGRTLVTLPAYFQLHYPAVGYQPDEINTVTLIGHQVRIKPTFKQNVFTYGDGSSSGPTSSGGGVYPDGDIKHAYDKTGKYVVGVSTTYGGQYSVDGGEWSEIPGQVTIAGPTSTLTVVATKNELVNQ